MDLTGKYEEAILKLELALSIEPKNVDIVKQLAELHEQQGQLQEAMEYYEFLYELETSQENFLLLLAAVIRNGEMPKIEKTVHDRMGTSEETGWLTVWMQQEELAEVLVWVEELPEEYPNLEMLKVALRAYAALLEGNEMEARKLLFDCHILAEGDYQLDGEWYFGQINAQGEREGVGICVYGSEVKPTSLAYIGEWKHNLRNGNGCAYTGLLGLDMSENSIEFEGSWEDDLPNGMFEMRGNAYIETATYVQGLGQGTVETIDWFDGEKRKYVRQVKDGYCQIFTIEIPPWGVIEVYAEIYYNDEPTCTGWEAAEDNDLSDILWTSWDH